MKMDWHKFNTYVDRAMDVMAVLFMFAGAMVILGMAFGIFVAVWNCWK